MMKRTDTPIQLALAKQCLDNGIEMEEMNDFAAAVDWYQRGLETRPQMPMLAYFLNNNLGYSLNQLARFHEAEPYCRRAIEIEASRFNAHKNLGVSLTGQKRYPEAARAFMDAVRACPEEPRALRCLERLVREKPELRSIEGLEAELGDCRHLGKREQN